MRHSPRIRPEKGILLALFLLCCFGIVMVYSSSAVRAIYESKPYLQLQVVKLLFGIVVLFCLRGLDYHHLGGRVARVILVGTFASLIFLALWRLTSGDEPRRWLPLGFASLQPSEFARIGLVVFLAAHVSEKGGRLERLRSLQTPLLVIGAMVFLIACQPSLSMALIVLMVAAGMLFLSGVPVRWLALGSAVPVTLAMTLGLAYQKERIDRFLDMLQGKGPDYQLAQSITAIGSGGIFGVGVGNGMQKYFFLPESHTDFILGIVGEETGFVGLVLLFAAYSLLVVMGMAAARHAPDTFGRLLAAGLTWNIAMNIGLHGAVNVGLMPVTGLPLPFLSYGGSSLIANIVAMGILLSVARRSVYAKARDWSSIGGTRW